MQSGLVNWLKYYRASVADGFRCCPTSGQIDQAKKLARSCVEDGQLPGELKAYLLKAGGGNRKELAGRKDADEAVEVMVFPWIFCVRQSHGQTWENWRKPFVPVVVMAWLRKDGALSPHEMAPWTPRDRLIPVAHEDAVVGSLECADKFAAERRYTVSRWADVMDYARALCAQVAGAEPEALEIPGYVLAAESAVAGVG